MHDLLTDDLKFKTNNQLIKQKHRKKVISSDVFSFNSTENNNLNLTNNSIKG